MTPSAQLAPYVIVAGVLLLMLLMRDTKFNSLPCAHCGERGKHRADCPARGKE